MSRSSEREARLDAFRRLHRCNTGRRHSRLGQRSPIAFETALEEASTSAAWPVSRIRAKGPTWQIRSIGRRWLLGIGHERAAVI